MGGRSAVQVNIGNIFLFFTTEISKANWSTERKRGRMHRLLDEIFWMNIDSFISWTKWKMIE